MSGIYIPGMEMPKNCKQCFYRAGGCKSNKHSNGRPQDCPLVEIPPHGDLIDRDALAVHKFVTEHDKYRQNDIPNMDGGACYRRGWDDAVDAIMVNASTVIPASEEGET